jgi:flagellar biosynthesis protein FlhF
LQVHTFIAGSASDAIAQIRAQLGPDAVVLNVRPLPATGLSRLWQKPQIEVLAHVPTQVEPPAPADGLAELKKELADIRTRMETPPAAEPALHVAPQISSDSLSTGPGPRWQVETVLERSGLSPVALQQILDAIRAEHGVQPPANLADEIECARGAMRRLWRPAPALTADGHRPHVLVGAAGTGKTTALCKWLAQIVLLEGRPAHVWRLDGATANTAEALSVYGEILGVPVARLWRGAEEAGDCDISFVDLPGVAWRNPAAVAELGRQLATFGSPHVHLVLNAAYETPLLLAQARAFAALPLADVVITHLDEEPRWGKLWNLALGTNLPLRFLGAGQNVPGDFHTATPEKIFAHQFAGKRPF